MRIGTMFIQKLGQMSISSKTASKAPTNIRKMVPGPRMEPTNKTVCDGRMVSNYFVKTLRLFVANFGINFSHKRNFGGTRDV
jgi:hypothetical protein